MLNAPCLGSRTLLSLDAWLLNVLSWLQEQLAELRSRQDHDLRETLAGDVADLRAAAGRSQADAPVKVASC